MPYPFRWTVAAYTAAVNRAIKLILFTALALLPALPATGGGPPHAALLHIDGAIGPATSGYFDKASRQAIDGGAALIVVEIDTPGGLGSAMRDIVRTILESPVPVVGYVAPRGARAASAGTYILYATHVAAMAPATNVGAATPVPANGDWPAPGGAGQKGEDQKSAGGKSDGDRKRLSRQDRTVSAEEVKTVNDAAAYLRSLAQMRGRNAEWAEQAVREGVSLSAEEALQQHVIDLIADSPQALLQQLDGRRIALAHGSVVLHTAGLPLQSYEPDWRMRLLGVLTNPTVAYLLMLAGIYGLLLEGYSPGATLPGVVGGICLVLALYALHLLPINYAGLGLIALGVVLMIAETLAPTFGALGFGGVVSFVLGSVFLMDTDVPGYDMNIGVVAGVAVAAAALLAVTIYMLWRSRRARTVTGGEGLVGQVAQTLQAIDGEGWAMVQGERWRVRCAAPLPAGAHVRVMRVDGLVLQVEPTGDPATSAIR
jgi:membrane-bound serine protease (ClpP class)